MPLPTPKAVQARRGQPDLRLSRTAGARAAAARGSNIGRRCCGRCSAHGSAHCGRCHHLSPTERRTKLPNDVVQAPPSFGRGARMGTLPSGRSLAVTSCQVLRPPQPSKNGRNHFLRPCLSSARLAALVQTARCVPLRVRGQSTPTWGPEKAYFRGIFPDSAGTFSCAPRTPLAGFYRTPLAGFYRPGRVFGSVLGRFRGGVSIYVMDVFPCGFRLVLNSNRIEIEKLGGSDRAARAPPITRPPVLP